MKKYISLTLVLLSILMLENKAEAQKKIALDDTAQIDSCIEHYFHCTTKDSVNEILSLLQEIDGALFNFLDYQNNTAPYQKHLDQFQAYLNKMLVIIQTAQNSNHAEHAKLKRLHVILVKVLDELKKAKGTKGPLAATKLGMAIDPLLKEFDHLTPFKMTTEDRLLKSYNIKTISYVRHLQGRLAIA